MEKSLNRGPGGLVGPQARRASRRGLVLLRKHASLGRRRSSMSLWMFNRLSKFYTQGAGCLRFRLTHSLGGLDYFFVSDAWARALSSTLALHATVESCEASPEARDFFWPRKLVMGSGGPLPSLPAPYASLSLATPLCLSIVKVLDFFS